MNGPRTSQEHDGTRYAIASAVVLLAGAAVELSRIILDAPWPGWSSWFSNTVSTLLCLLWSSAALSVLMRRRHPWFGNAAWALSLAAPLVMVVHGVFTRVGGSGAGFLYVPAGALVVFCLKRTWDGQELKRVTARQL